jgi:hypothetical protein
MKILTITSPAYLDITEKLIKQSKFPIMAEKVEQIGDPNFGTPDFNRTMLLKVKSIIEHLKETNILFFIDSDVLLFEDPSYFVNKLGDKDMMFQREPDNTVCTGFFVAKNNEKVLDLFNEVLTVMEENPTMFNEQQVINLLIKGTTINYGVFDDKDVYSYGLATGGKVWKGEELDIEIPKDIKAFHANYTIGLENKKRLLDLALHIAQLS